jgi:hypothetical protein
MKVEIFKIICEIWENEQRVTHRNFVEQLSKTYPSKNTTCNVEAENINIISKFIGKDIPSLEFVKEFEINNQYITSNKRKNSERRN